MATKKATASTPAAYDKNKIAAFLKEQAANAAAQVKRTKVQILQQDFSTELSELKTKGFSAKQVAELINTAAGGFDVSEAAVRSYYAEAVKAAAALAPPKLVAAAPSPAPAVAAAKK